MTAPRRAPQVLFWVLLAAGTGLLAGMSRAPWVVNSGIDGILRISLSARPDRVETCHALSAEELAARPAHMRQAVVCEGGAARYRLTVASDAARLLDEEVTGGGARSDRPMHLLREFPLAAGSHHLSVRFVLLDSLPADSTPGTGREAAERDRRRREAVPVEMTIDTTIAIAAQRVVLVTYDPQLRRLIVLASPRAP